MNMTLQNMTLQRAQVFMKTLFLATLGVLLLIVAFIILEPAVSKAQIEDQFIVTQVVTAEISFQVTATDVALSPSIPGITGGTSNGGTQLIVNTNNTTGYNLTIISSSSPAMQGNATSDVIPNYSTSTAPDMAEPEFNFSASEVPTNDAGFGYTVEASTTADLDPSFLDDGSDCNIGASSAASSCWIGASTTAFTIINTSSATAASGATTTLRFRVVINSSPSPSISEDTYVATTTLTATTN